jgi:hypothetical protein
VVKVSRYEGPATIQQGDRQVGVDCVYTVRPPGESRGTWFGRFTDAKERLATGDADLYLEGGELGRILIDHINEMTGRSGTFTGARAPPKA